MELVLSSTPEGIELRRNPSLFKMSLIKNIYLQMLEKWFKGILCGVKDADLIILSIGSLVAGLSCMEKFPNTKAIGIYTFPSLRTAEFSPPGFGGKSESMFGWINTMKWKMFEHVSFNMYNNEINQLRASIDLPPIKESVPHSWLFLNMSAAIHHGGVGTTHASLRYGLPTLILPFGADQPFNDDRIFINKLGPRYIF
ncbi:unnamed protein product [Rotaria sp. Silwood2]|nr:unnamed protein product [Rotaria sp. Silwood2]